MSMWISIIGAIAAATAAIYNFFNNVGGGNAI